MRSAVAPDRPRRSLLRTWALLLAGPLAAFLLAEALLRNSGWLWTEVAAGSEPGAALPVESALRAAARRPPQVVVVGSSIARHGVDPGILERELGLGGGGALNLGLNGDSLTGTAMLLPRVLALRPRAVVLVAGPEALNWAPRLSDDRVRFYDPATARRLFPPGRLLAEGEDHLRAALGSASVLVRHRDEVQRWLGGRRRRPADAERNRHIPAEVFAAWRAPVAAADRELNTAALALSARRCRAAGVRLLVVVAPGHPRMPGFEHAAAEGRALAALARRLGLEVLEEGGLGSFAAFEFRDPRHLGEAGRERLTRAVARALSARS